MELPEQVYQMKELQNTDGGLDSLKVSGSNLTSPKKVILDSERYLLITKTIITNFPKLLDLETYRTALGIWLWLIIRC